MNDGNILNKVYIYIYYSLFFVIYYTLNLEDVIRRRLLIDGDGTGDDRRLNVLVKSFIKWVNTADTPDSM